MQCARCGANLASEDRFCTRCGTPVSVGRPAEVVCAHCGNKLGSRGSLLSCLWHAQTGWPDAGSGPGLRCPGNTAGRSADATAAPSRQGRDGRPAPLRAGRASHGAPPTSVHFGFPSPAERSGYLGCGVSRIGRGCPRPGRSVDLAHSSFERQSGGHLALCTPESHPAAHSDDPGGHGRAFRRCAHDNADG